MLIRLLKDRNVIFLLALAAGFLWPRGADWMKDLTLPSLAVVMAVATMTIPNDAFRSWRRLLGPALVGIAMNYLLLGSAIVAMGACFVQDEQLRVGLVLVAAVPPAVAVIPFTAILGGRTNFSLMGTVGGYLGGLLIMPLMFTVLIGQNFADPGRLLWIMTVLIGLPLIVSRLCIHYGWHERIAPYRGPVTDWGFFIVLYNLIGVNRDVILGRPAELLPVSVIVFLSMFGLGFLIEQIGRLFHQPADRIVSLVLLGTMKNQGLAGGLALTLFPTEVALPAAVSSIFMILYFIWLDLRERRRLGLAEGR